MRSVCPACISNRPASRRSGPSGAPWPHRSGSGSCGDEADRADGEVSFEDIALARDTLDQAHVSPVKLRDLARDEQAEPEASEPARALGALERLEDALAILHRHARALIA